MRPATNRNRALRENATATIGVRANQGASNRTTTRGKAGAISVTNSREIEISANANSRVEAIICGSGRRRAGNSDGGRASA